MKANKWRNSDFILVVYFNIFRISNIHLSNNYRDLISGTTIYIELVFASEGFVCTLPIDKILSQFPTSKFMNTFHTTSWACSLKGITVFLTVVLSAFFLMCSLQTVLWLSPEEFKETYEEDPADTGNQIIDTFSEFRRISATCFSKWLIYIIHFQWNTYCMACCFWGFHVLYL